LEIIDIYVQYDNLVKIDSVVTAGYNEMDFLPDKLEVSIKADDPSF